MRYFRIAFVFGLALMIFAGCTKEEIQPDSQDVANDATFKKAKMQKGPGHFVPFHAKFEVTAYFNKFGPVVQKDFQTPWETPSQPGGMYVNIVACGNATHLGKTNVEIDQWWSPWFPGLTPPDSYGQGTTVFYAANGDELWGTYYGTADHQDDPPTEILTFGVFTGGTGKFEGAKGSFVWKGIFVAEFSPKLNPVPSGTAFGTGSVNVTGSIQY